MDEDNFMIASSNIRPYGSRCTLLHAAIWTHDGEVNYEGATSDSFHISEHTEKNMKRVASRSLESITKQFQVKRIDYLKMDIEGAERVLMETADQWAEIVDTLNVETHASDIMAEVTHKLTSLGFSCKPSELHWASVLAVRE
jgi:FkbM family methyltransferase